MVRPGDHLCPVCGGLLSGYDHIWRTVKGEFGIKEKNRIKRMRCTECGKLHNVLPDEIEPKKHYRKDILDRFKNDSLTNDELEFEDFPSESTVKRWKRE